jgi:hypothetical protein
MLLLAAASHGQSSSSYQVTDQAINAAGHPEAGVVLSSTSYQVSIDSLGDGVRASPTSSGRWAVQAGFPSCYSPPTEVRNLRLTGEATLRWNAEPSVGSYNVYRGSLPSLPGSGGACLDSRLTSTTTSDSYEPHAGQTMFYLVTAENRVTEEGTRGFDSVGTERPQTSPCP